jgi:hypothetical protein
MMVRLWYFAEGGIMLPPIHKSSQSPISSDVLNAANAYRQADEQEIACA